MSTQTDTTARTFRSALVGWCLECHCYYEPYVAGQTCMFDCERPSSLTWPPTYRRLAKRRMLICSECEMCFTTQEGAEEHDCYSAY